MRTLLILSLFSLTSCAGSFPQFPKIAYIYEVDLDLGKCARFEVISTSPFKIKYKDDLDISECNAKVAVNPKDFQALLLFKDKAERWAKKNNRCF